MCKYDWSNKSMLVVEDLAMNRLLIKCIVEKTNIDLTFAENGKDFINIVNKNKFDLILMDINLGGGLDGIDLMNYMKDMNIRIPVIVQTAYDMEYKVDVKYDDIIRKPYGHGELCEKINKLFKK